MWWCTDLSTLIGMQLPIPSSWRSALTQSAAKPQASPLAAMFPTAGRLRFTDDLEPAFARYHAGHSLPLARLALVLALLLYALFGVLDLYADPGAAGWIWMIRYAIFCPAALSVLALTFTRHFGRFMQPLLSAVATVAGLGIVAMIAIASPAVGHLYYAGLLLVVPWAYTVLQLRFSYATKACLAIMTGYETVAIWLKPTPRKSSSTTISSSCRPSSSAWSPGTRGNAAFARTSSSAGSSRPSGPNSPRTTRSSAPRSTTR